MTRMLLPQNLRPLRSLRASFAPSSPPIFVPKQRDQCINCQSQLKSCIWHWIRCVGQGFCCCLQCDLSQFIYHLDILQKIQCVHYVSNIITFQPQPCVSFYCILVIYCIFNNHVSFSKNQLSFGCSQAFRPKKNLRSRTSVSRRETSSKRLAFCSSQAKRLGGIYRHLAPVGFGNWFIMSGWQMI